MNERKLEVPASAGGDWNSLDLTGGTGGQEVNSLRGLSCKTHGTAVIKRRLGKSRKLKALRILGLSQSVK